MTRAAAWPGLSAGAEPADPAVGPFPLSPFLEAWWARLGRGEAFELAGGGSLLPLTREGRTVRIAGDADLTDYHSPLGPDPEALGEGLAELARQGLSLELDSLPEASAQALARGLASSGVEAPVSSHQVAMVIDLSSGSGLGLMTGKQRHEVERKRRRYQEAVGEVVVTEGTGEGHFTRFADLHRAAPGRKGRFLVGSNLGFFAELSGQQGWTIHELQAGDRVAAALFGFADREAYYLYNSAYDPSLRELSPGIVLLTEVIESVARLGVSRFDFLKGDETYKSRFGAEPRALYRIEVG